MSDAPVLTAAELATLRKFDTPTICNVIEVFDIRPRNTGYMDKRITACYPKLPPMVGYATTATFRSNAPPRSSDVYGSIEKQLEVFPSVPSPPVVVFQDVDDPVVAATFGEVMCATYKAFGAAGIITSGGGRDIDQVGALEFPAFVGSVICSHGYCHILDINVPVHVGGLTVYPGDLLHGDRNGVTTIPREIGSQVARVTADFIAAEEEVIGYVRRGSPTVAGFIEARKGMMAKIKAIAESVKRR